MYLSKNRIMEQNNSTPEAAAQNQPKTCLYCFQDGCAKAATCIHYFAGQHPDGRKVGLCVLAAALSDDGCSYYKETRLLRGAWGFKALFEDVKAKDAPLLRRAMMKRFGSYFYYGVHHGEQLLNPEEQAWVLALFNQYGYTENLSFDGYTDVYDW